MNEEDFEQTGAGWWIQVIGCIAYIAIIIAYAWQTVQLVSWLIPDDNIYMRGVTVFVCDGCATGYAMAEMFYRFRLRKSKNLVFGMWIITFLFSTAATVIQMYLSSIHAIPHTIDPAVITVAYGIVIVAFVTNILAITVIIRMERSAGRPSLRYLDDPRRPERPVRRVVESKPAQKRVAQPAPRKAIAGRSRQSAVLAKRAQSVTSRQIAAQTVTPEPDEEEIDEDQANEAIEEEDPETDAEASYLDELAQSDEEDQAELEPDQDTEEIDVIEDEPGPHGIEDDEEEAGTGHVPFTARLANAMEALTNPSATGPSRMRRRK